MNNVIIHHISDVHIGPVHYSSDRKLPFSQINEIDDPSFGRNADNYLKHLELLKTEELPDFILVSGDITSYATENEMYAAKSWMIKLSDIVRKKEDFREAKDPCIFVVPGNHDINWGEKEYSKKINRFNAAFESLIVDGILGAVPPSKKECFFYCKKANILFYLFNTTKLGGSDRKDILNIYDKLASIETELNDSNNSKNMSHLLSDLEGAIKQDPGYIQESDLVKMQDNLNDKSNSYEHVYKIALMHHNPVSVPSDDLETFDTIINAGLVKQYLVNAQFDMVCYGHRHIAHGSNERYLSSNDRQGIYYIGAPSLGCNDSGSFLKIELFDTHSAHKEELPSVLMKVHEMKNKPARPYYESSRIAYEPVDKPMHDLLHSIHLFLGRYDKKLNVGEQKQLSKLIKTLSDEQDRLYGWKTKERNWTDIFYDYLDSYRIIYATDLDDRYTISSPKFQTYLTQQFKARIKSLKNCKSKEIRFSSAVMKAITRTGWVLDDPEWKDYKIMQSGADSQLQIVRVLIKDDFNEIDKERLYKLEYDHKRNAIPIFVIEKKYLKTDSLRDLTMGIDRNGDIQRCYSYRKEKGIVLEDSQSDASILRGAFEELLDNTHLRTLSDYISRSMLFDSYKMEEYSKTYDDTRKASSDVVNFIKSESSIEEGVVVDIGCGTGNYTLPLVKMGFSKVFGHDTCKYMLKVAKAKDTSAKVSWVEGDAREMKVSDKCDLIISICSLHYIVGQSQQKLLFKNMYSQLKPGGKIIFEAEFLETLQSFWLLKYFPELLSAYSKCCHSIDFYKGILQEIGFKNVEIKGINDKSTQDGMLRIGQSNPEIYLNSNILDNMPIFRINNTASQISQGKKRLFKDMKSKNLEGIIKSYQNNIPSNFKSSDNIFFIVAERL